MLVSATTLDIIRIEVLGESRAVTMPASLWVEFRDKLPALIYEAGNVLTMLDELAELWGDEGKFRRCRDRLRAAINEARVFNDGKAWIGEEPD